MDITNKTILRCRFAETYSKSDSRHPLEQFREYELVTTHRENVPDVGGRRLGRRLELPEGRLNGWFGERAPTGYDATQTADEYGWLDLDWDGTQFSGFNRLVAWCLSGGALSTSYMATFSVEEQTHNQCADALEATGIQEYELLNDGTPERATEIRVREVPTVFGRMLAALGAPVGAKATQQYGLPPYLAIAPDSVCREFVAIYLLNRGTESNDGLVVVREERPQRYLESLGGLFRATLGIEVSRRGEFGLELDSNELATINWLDW